METEKSLAVKIKKKNGEKVIAFLKDNNLIRFDLKILHDDHYLYIPITARSPKLSGLNTTSIEFEKTKKKISSYQQLLSLPKDVQQVLPTSFDIVGDILLVNLSDQVMNYASEIGNALLTAHSQVNTVCSIEPVSGELRTRSVNIIAGEKKTRTIHKEYGLWFEVDVEKTYFSQRLATERRRITHLIKEESFVFDMFCGVAPFSIMIASFSSPKLILACDKNHCAIQLAKRNVEKNNVENRIILKNIDSRNAMSLLRTFDGRPDHIIMNLPFSAFEFFPIALNAVADDGMIHYYDIIEESSFDNRISQLQEIAESVAIDLVETKIHKIKTYAPHEFYIGIDITVSKN